MLEEHEYHVRIIRNPGWHIFSKYNVHVDIRMIGTARTLEQAKEMAEMYVATAKRDYTVADYYI